ncbi:MAG: hypothetical protein AAGL49_13625 [Pseudomonadota bacterium]
MREFLIGLLSAVVGGALVAFFVLRGEGTEEAAAPAPLVSAEGVPAGAVVAFDGAACPTGWSAYRDAEGRFVMGADIDTPPTSVGGRRTVTLTPEQAPPHAHGLVPSDRQGTEAYWGFVAGEGTYSLNKGQNGLGSAVVLRAPETASAGAGAPIDITPSYVALTYCRKD